ncbi:Cation efflux system protein CusA [Anaerohalosphaera lusitana]|uniref:Cation efflux system protein CusA n=1 Tax=Anaerohalosphaera lusitana TaxID=1936003 RepID=A0A1U9NPE4_9BACT|nr:efflux RND transporter permease subunit [Anaerohalosphaera lusitana]AQT69480.1 Cation efflux system protein CusA [Anaerohalosphaera lusitana]
MNERLDHKASLIDKTILFCLKNKLIVGLLVIFVVGWGFMVAPFDWEVSQVPRDPVPVDAIPDIGENQQIVFTEWPGRSPQDVEDQITYPMTVSLLGMPGVKTVRSFSFFGFSSIYVIFEEDVEFYWSRSRVLEKLNSLPEGTLPEGVKPALGPDATALGQVFWYTLEGRDKEGNPAGGWDLDELRSVQDWFVRYGLMSAEGVSEVASVGGFVREYQIDVDPDAMRAAGVTLPEIFSAVKSSNVDVGARMIELNRAEYVVRGLGFIEDVDDIRDTVVKVTDNVPITVEQVGHVTLGPALRRGALDKGGAEAVGGVVVVRYGYNPLEAIKNVKAKIEEISPGLPEKTLADGTTSKLTIVPFYDRTGLIYETLGTLESALTEEILVTIIVVVILVMHFGSSVLISGLLPLAVLMCFIAMKLFGVDANIVALSGIAIAIGTMVDMGIVICENILKHLERAGPGENTLEVVYRAASEVASAVVTAVMTTVVSFLPVFTMTGAEGKLFRPLAFTKTFALVAAVVVAITIIPPAAHILFTKRFKPGKVLHMSLAIVLGVCGVFAGIMFNWWIGAAIVAIAIYQGTRDYVPERIRSHTELLVTILTAAFVGVILTTHWLPLGPEEGMVKNIVFVGLLIGSLLVFFKLFQKGYPYILGWCLRHKTVFMMIPSALVLLAVLVWFGFANVFGFVPERFRTSLLWTNAQAAFPGLGKEFMPPLDEGSFLYMPTTMPHASIGEALDIIKKQDVAFEAIPEVESAVGKIGRADTPLDPAPISMIETVINYKSEYKLDEDGHRIRFRYDEESGEFVRDEQGELIPDEDGRPYRQWREHIKSPSDIWDEIVDAGKIPGTTSAPVLQPISARLVMLQSGMRAPMGIKVKGPDLETIEAVGLELEKYLKQVPAVKASAVIADRVVGKPYIEIDIDREAIARYGMSIGTVQDVIEVAIGGKRITTTVEGRERYPVRVRYMRELRDEIETLGEILVPASDGAQIPLTQLADIDYVRGPQAIKSEDTFLTSYVLFDKNEGYAEVDTVEQAQAFLQEKIEAGEFKLPAGVSYAFAGSYENQIRAQRTLSIVVPLALLIIFIILYMQFKSVSVTSLIFSGIIVAWSGGFMLIWLYGQDWFLDFSVLGTNMRELFQVHTINLSVAIWVGFLALFGIASDDGVVMCTYLQQTFDRRKTESVEEVREAVIEAGKRRIRPCLMTTATTILALIPVLTSTGRGSDIMVPMAIPSVGGMTIEVLTTLVVPVLYCAIRERRAVRS